MDASQLTFKQLADKLQPNHFKGQLICLDPGETTGWAVFRNGTLLDVGQLATKDLISGTRALKAHFEKHMDAGPEGNRTTRVVFEDYRIYGWKTEEHTWAGLHTPKLIGSIVALCVVMDLSFDCQMAQQAKGFCTDEKLQNWGFYVKGLRHGRDAIRHGAYYLLFNKEQ